MTKSKENMSERVKKAYEKHADLLYRTAFAKLMSKHDAEDTVAEVFAKYINCAPVFNDDAHEKAWLLKVTMNRCVDFMRKRAVRSYYPIDELSEVLQADDSSDQRREVLEAVLSLDEKYRVCTVLHYFEDLSIDDVSKALGITKSAVKMRLLRAREMLKSVLE